jgi:hypothetical protein
MATDHQGLMQRMAAAMEAVDPDLWEVFYTEDIVQVYPQSGEVIRGRANARAVFENYPGGLGGGSIPRDTVSVASTDQRWVMTPLFTLVAVEGTGDVGTATMTVRYPDSSTWWVVTLYRLRGEKLAHATVFFAPVFDPPEWRAHWVEVEPRGTATGASRPLP